MIAHTPCLHLYSSLFLFSPYNQALAFSVPMMGSNDLQIAKRGESQDSAYFTTTGNEQRRDHSLAPDTILS